MSLSLTSVTETFDSMFRDIEGSDRRFSHEPSFFRSQAEMDREQAEFATRSLKLMDDERARFDNVIDPALNDREFHGDLDCLASMSPHISGTQPTDAQLLAVAKRMLNKLSRNAFEHCSGEF